MNVEQLWNSFLEKIKGRISKISYDTWFADSKLIEIKDNVAIVLVSMHIQKKNLKENYNDLIEEVFTEVSGSNFKFKYVLEEELENNIEINTDVIGVPNNNFETNLNSKYTFDNFIVNLHMLQQLQ